MHELQQKLLRLAQEKNLGQYTLRALGAMVGDNSPQKLNAEIQWPSGLVQTVTGLAVNGYHKVVEPR